jgi:tRNA threonylcarbamoyladenosine biosynthesis protein TsaB
MPRSSKILFIDTATEYVFLSLVIDGVETGYAYKNDTNNHAVTIMPMLDEMLKSADLALKEMDEVIVGIGPGSYTGVRIGVAIAKMIGYLNQIPVKTVSTLALLASSSQEKNVLASIDARRGNAFMAGYRQMGGRMEETIPDTLANVESFKKSLEYPYAIVTTGKPDVLKILNSNLLKDVQNIHELVPNYLQVTEAERNKGKA